MNVRAEYLLYIDNARTKQDFFFNSSYTEETCEAITSALRFLEHDVEIYEYEEADDNSKFEKTIKSYYIRRESDEMIIDAADYTAFCHEVLQHINISLGFLLKKKHLLTIAEAEEVRKVLDQRKENEFEYKATEILRQTCLKTGGFKNSNANSKQNTDRSTDGDDNLIFD